MSNEKRSDEEYVCAELPKSKLGRFWFPVNPDGSPDTRPGKHAIVVGNFHADNFPVGTFISVTYTVTPP